MKVEELDRSKSVWIYRPSTHKTLWRRQGREILLGPAAQTLLLPRLPESGYVFRNKYGGRYLGTTYTHEVAKACALAGVKWTPYQIRHAAATRLSAQFGPDIARRILGHRSLSMTAHYDHCDLTKAAELMAKFG